MHTNQSELKFSFGSIKIEVGVDGNIDRPDALIDHMLSAANTVLGMETVQRGISDVGRNGGKTKQTCSTMVEFGEITIKAEVVFDLNHSFSNRMLNSLVLGEILPCIWRSASVYLGAPQTMTTPQAPLSPISRRQLEAIRDISLGLALPPEAEVSSVVPAGERQLVSTH